MGDRRRRALAAVAALAAALAGAVWQAAPARAYPSSSVSLDGHGWGHGRGMGQWGALGYALQGQTYSWMLDHYYGGTSFGAALPNSTIRVRIVENDGNDVIVTSGSPFTVAGVAYAAGQGALMRLTAPHTWQIMQAPGCAGPWAPVATASDQGTGPQAVAVPSVTDPNASSTQVLQLCQATANLYLRGSIGGNEINGVPRTVNSLPMESYLRGVVPSESPAYWGGLGAGGAQGQPQGFQELEVQAVAARSYAAADRAANGGTGAYGYADICDSTACQAYRGQVGENARTDAAVADTAGQVRRFSDGSIATTEFSSSTGGWTAGGTFPAVPDDGDAVCVTNACNPNHNWSASVPVASIQSAYPAIGTLQAVQITARSGPAQADWGGRVQTMVLQGSNGSVQLTGAAFAGTFGLKSNWFTVVGVPSGGVDGYWIGAADGGVFSFGAAKFYGSAGGMRLNRPVVGMAGVRDGGGYWLVAGDGGIFTFGDARFFGSTGAMRLNQPVVGMVPTADGAGYWLVASDGGIFTFGDARFYGSTGGMRLNKPIIGMATTADGRGYWLFASDGGIFTFGDATFHGSAANQALSQPVTDAVPTPDGGGYWILDGDGTVFPYGDAAGYGSFATIGVSDHAVSMQSTADGRGYLVATGGGNVWSFGDAPSFGGVSQQVPGYNGRALALVGRYGP